MSNCGKCGHKIVRAKGSTRESCIHCVEKHVGSAMVQISEINDGYDFRILVVGNLHEAEDESQSWKELHNEIRQSRILWQTEDKMPNWFVLGKMITDVLINENNQQIKLDNKGIEMVLSSQHESGA